MEWRRFRLRYRALIKEVHDRHPGFWTELRDLAEDRDRRRTTTRGATVREFPRTREQGTQASGGRTLGQRLFEVAAPGVHHAGTQTAEAVRQSTGVQVDPSPPIIAAVEPRLPGRGRGRLTNTNTLRRPGLSKRCNPQPQSPPPELRAIATSARELPKEEPPPPKRQAVVSTRPPTRGPNVCWNCRATDHRYSACPWPKDRQYCYGCGREGVTLRTCPRYRDDWRDLGPYHPDRGHLGKS